MTARDGLAYECPSQSAITRPDDGSLHKTLAGMQVASVKVVHIVDSQNRECVETGMEEGWENMLSGVQ